MWGFGLLCKLCICELLQPIALGASKTCAINVGHGLSSLGPPYHALLQDGQLVCCQAINFNQFAAPSFTANETSRNNSLTIGVSVVVMTDIVIHSLLCYVVSIANIGSSI